MVVVVFKEMKNDLCFRRRRFSPSFVNFPPLLSLSMHRRPLDSIVGSPTSMSLTRSVLLRLFKFPPPLSYYPPQTLAMLPPWRAESSGEGGLLSWSRAERSTFDEALLPSPLRLLREPMRDPKAEPPCWLVVVFGFGFVLR